MSKRVRYDGGVREERQEEGGEQQQDSVVSIDERAHNLRDQGSEQEEDVEEEEEEEESPQYVNERARRLRDRGHGSQRARRDQVIQRDIVRALTFCLMLLSLLFVVRTVDKVIDYHSTTNHSKTDINLTMENAQLKSDFNNLIVENSQLKADRDRLKADYNNLTLQGDQLKTAHDNLVQENAQLMSDFDNLIVEKNQLNIQLTREKAGSSADPDECCFEYHTKPLPKNNVVTFQRTHIHCVKAGVLLIMKNGCRFCVDPTQNWVQSIITTVESKRV